MQVFVCPVVYSRTRNAVAALAGTDDVMSSVAARSRVFMVVSFPSLGV